MGFFGAQIHHLPHRFHIASGAVAVPTAPGWVPILLVAIAIFAVGLWWASTRV
ncbi:MAG: hypothetical protein M0Z66_03505 [Thermaerobacter sp.]|nr:hypothetical protein [Thermaerobacter sp.]